MISLHIFIKKMYFCRVLSFLCPATPVTLISLDIWFDFHNFYLWFLNKKIYICMKNIFLPRAQFSLSGHTCHRSICRSDKSASRPKKIPKKSLLDVILEKFKSFCFHFYPISSFLKEKQLLAQKSLCWMHTWYLSFFLHLPNFLINFSPRKSAKIAPKWISQN